MTDAVCSRLLTNANQTQNTHNYKYTHTHTGRQNSIDADKLHLFHAGSSHCLKSVVSLSVRHSVLLCCVLFCYFVFCSVLFYSFVFCSVLFCSVLCCCVLFCSDVVCSFMVSSGLSRRSCHLFCSLCSCSFFFCSVLCWISGLPLNSGAGVSWRLFSVLCCSALHGVCGGLWIAVPHREYRRRPPPSQPRS